MTGKQKIVVAILFIAVPVIMQEVIGFNRVFFNILFFSIFPISSLLDLITFKRADSGKDLFYQEEKIFHIVRGYVIPLGGVFWMLMVLNVNIGNIERFNGTQIELLHIFLSVYAAMCLIGQIGHVVVSVTSKFLNYSFKTYLLLFAFSYLTCALSFSVLYACNMESFHNTTATHITVFDLVYFSFITLSSTGYGDISPIEPLTKLYSILETFFGLFFTGYLITMIFSTRRKPTESANP